MMAKQLMERQTISKKKLHSKAFKEGIATLKDEIQLAFQWHRPSILLAIHGSNTGRLKAQQTLEKDLKKTNKRVEYIKVDGKSPDVISIMSETPNHDEIVFFISGVGSTESMANGDVYSALNLHRELLVEDHIRAVFWLSESEAANLPSRAPDFWAFRHRVVEFSSNRGTRKNALPAGLLLWKDQFPLIDQETQRNALAYQEDVLARLPQEESALTTRIETLLTLAHICWILNDSRKFSNYLALGFALTEKYSIPHFQTWLLNAKGIGLYEAEKQGEAILLFKQALTRESHNSILMMNLSVAYHALGRSRDAILIGKRAIKQDANNPRLWNVLGYLYLSMGKLADAIESTKRAQQMDSDNIHMYYSLAVCYYKNGQFDACGEEMRKAGEISPRYDTLQLVYEGIMTGKANEALARLRQSLEKGEITKQQIARDPNLQALLSPQEWKNLS
jgi:Flp pilus assembly protein TadD